MRTEALTYTAAAPYLTTPISHYLATGTGYAHNGLFSVQEFLTVKKERSEPSQFVLIHSDCAPESFVEPGCTCPDGSDWTPHVVGMSNESSGRYLVHSLQTKLHTHGTIVRQHVHSAEMSSCQLAGVGTNADHPTETVFPGYCSNSKIQPWLKKWVNI